MTVGKCKTCGETIRSRRSDKNSAQANFLKAVKAHYKKKHPNTISRRISQGKRSSYNNPSFQDFFTSLSEGPRAAIKIYRAYTERQYQHIKVMMDAIEPILPVEVLASWKAIEAIHDEYLT